MKKIMFDTKFGLEQAVLEGKKTQRRGTCRVQPPYEYYDIAFPCGWKDEDNPEKDPLYGAFCWVNKDNSKEHTNWVKPTYRFGEVVAIAQSYKDIFSEFSQHPNPQLNICVKNPTDTAGWTNKMFVKACMMPHKIRIDDVRLERLQDISEADCLKEGIVKMITNAEYYTYCFFDSKKVVWVDHSNPRDAFADLINRTCGKGTWESNPYVFAYTFKLIK